MNDMYGGGSVLSFTKVPCTPISGAFGNYFDVFGDVDHNHRLGTADSLASSYSSDSSNGDLVCEIDRLPPIRAPSSASSAIFMKTSPIYCKTCSNRLSLGSSKSRKRTTDSEYHDRKASGQNRLETSSDPHILFLEEKQSEILVALHEEIRTLKHENAELKFQIHVILRQDSCISPISSAHRKVKNKSLEYTDDHELLGISEGSERETTLAIELESAAKLIEELKWIQQHYETKMRLQDAKMADMMRQLNFQSDTETELIQEVPFQIQSDSELTEENTLIRAVDRPSISGRQRTPAQRLDFLNRRNSLQSILPDNYKQKVATLPPILAKQIGNPLSSIRSTSSVQTRAPMAISTTEIHAGKSARKNSIGGQPFTTIGARNHSSDMGTRFSTEDNTTD